jgi:hypothetical protein
MPDLRLRVIDRDLPPPGFTPLPIEGFGKNATGGAGHVVKTVTSEAASGTGSLDSILNHTADQTSAPANMIIQWAQGINIGRINGLRNIFENVTIDGFANGHNGVVIDSSYVISGRPIEIRGRWVGSPGGNVIIRGVNFRGPLITMGAGNDDLLALNGQGPAGSYAGVDGPVLIERCTFWGAGDGASDAVASGSHINNVTIQACLFYDCCLPALFKYGARNNISFHHNVLTRCGERPQIKGPNNYFDWINNVDFRNHNSADFPLNWYIATAGDGEPIDPYSLRIWNSRFDITSSANGPPDPIVNVRGNVFLGDVGKFQLITDTGASEAGNYWDPFSTTETGLGYNWRHGGGIYYSTNEGNSWSYNVKTSPRGTPNDISDGQYAITVHPASQLKDFFPMIGAPNRLGDDQYVLDTTAAYMP